jgi:GTP pyrophosphokinase
VHAEDCPNVQNLLYDPQRRIDVAWEGAASRLFPVEVAVHTEDRPGMLAKLTALIAEERTNIRNAEARTTEEGKGRISLVLEVRDVAHLRRIMDKLRAVPGVHHVERVSGT